MTCVINCHFQTIFLGYGSTFKFKTKVPAFENIELYNVMCGKAYFCLHLGLTLKSVFACVWFQMTVLRIRIFFRYLCKGMTVYMVFICDLVYLFFDLTSKLSVPLSDLLGLKPAPNNGTHGSLNHLLRNPPFRPTMPEEISRPTASNHVPVITDDLGCSCNEKVSHDKSLKDLNGSSLWASHNWGTLYCQKYPLIHQIM